MSRRSGNPKSDWIVSLYMRVIAIFCASLALVSCSPDPPSAGSGKPAISNGTPEPQKTHEQEEVSARTQPSPGEVVFYRLHPDPDKVDRYCGAFDRSYIVRHVEVPQGARNVLTRAVRALFVRYFRRPGSQVEKVVLEQGRATIDLRSTRGIESASTSCGGVGFMGALLRTVFQFDSVDALRVTLQGSCQRFGEFMQAGRCQTFTRSDI